MAKRADDDAHLLTFLTSITDLVSIIGDYFEDCCMHDPEEDDSTYTGRTSRKQVHSERSVIDFLGNE